ncbi:ATP-binding protein [Actinacidiphila sp. DG2A-62]|uniref:ATP-binding protein n=1 Tax=Actinacidiphila sp. DG2A-62 TaxID=3108821 RepID=UPI002DB8CDCC|nr:ATP-binding protein [Actinacidiphila sp. DG2A-62]MEC3997005.1 ATP-binding protein [Actinacidiphila sp. DG2A-62]
MTNPFRGRAAALVGRDDEIEVLASVLQDATAGRGGTLFVAGEPGIGKTRLTAEAVAMATRAGMAVLKGRCTTTGPAVPFRPLTEALLSLTRAGEAPPAAELGPYLPVLGRLVPEWSTGGDCDQSPIVLAEAVLRLAAARGRDRGCLLLIDDLHDADPETLAVLEYIAANVAGQPVAVVATVRSAPSTAYELAGAVTQRREALMLTLGRLDAAHIHAFAASCLGCARDDLAPAVSAHVYADSDGIPFVAEELIRGMLAEERLRFDRGRWRDVDDAEEANGVIAPGGTGAASAADPYAAGLGPGGPVAPTTWGTADWFASDGFPPGAADAPASGLAQDPPNGRAALPLGGDAAPYAANGHDTSGSRAGTPGAPAPAQPARRAARPPAPRVPASSARPRPAPARRTAPPRTSRPLSRPTPTTPAPATGTPAHPPRRTAPARASAAASAWAAASSAAATQRAAVRARLRAPARRRARTDRARRTPPVRVSGMVTTQTAAAQAQFRVPAGPAARTDRARRTPPGRASGSGATSPAVGGAGTGTAERGSAGASGAAGRAPGGRTREAGTPSSRWAGAGSGPGRGDGPRPWGRGRPARAAGGGSRSHSREPSSSGRPGSARRACACCRPPRCWAGRSR